MLWVRETCRSFGSQAYRPRSPVVRVPCGSRLRSRLGYDSLGAEGRGGGRGP